MLRVYGVRHHGPGCARSLDTALDAFDPDVVLIEGPPDADDQLALLADAAASPPLALMIYDDKRPRDAAFYPFTAWSPETRAALWALRRGRSARFFDLPQSLRFQLRAEHPARQDPEDDPFTRLARAAGYPDHQRWWEHEIEQRVDDPSLFDAILEAITALRGDALWPDDPVEATREAWMRRELRRTCRKKGVRRVAVVCGAWHAPALLGDLPQARDDRQLKGLRRKKLKATWVPWTDDRLALRSGYGAGIDAPGWYGCLWAHASDAPQVWLTRAARLLREEGADVAAGHVIEAARLAGALAGLRGLSTPGLTELREAIEAVLCHGDPLPMRLIAERLEIGQSMGSVPEGTPAPPLARDIEAAQRRLRLKPRAFAEELELDLREPRAVEKSELLHRLGLLGVPWGTRQEATGRERGAFHEYWSLKWAVDFPLRIIEANVWGNTLVEAATARVATQARELRDLATLTELLDGAVLAALPEAVDEILEVLRARAALSTDIGRLMRALAPLIRVRRYGDARQTPSEHLDPVIEGLFERVLVGLPRACGSLDEDAARHMVDGIGQLHTSLALLEREDLLDEWREVLQRIAWDEDLAGLVRGRCGRLLLEAQLLDAGAMERLTATTLSPAVPAREAADWLEGMVRGSGLTLLHQDALWRALNEWLERLDEDDFRALLPILRRAFSDFSPPERRAMGERIRDLERPRAPDVLVRQAVDTARAARVLPVLRQVLGVSHVRG
ncbi:MAG: hypothetical protein H6739_07555 [Alphaproteobacteria bacterium]|nr:hypothetical protein [Alphaproteobacteria bacterium]